MAEKRKGTTARGSAKKNGGRKRTPSPGAPQKAAAAKGGGPQGAAKRAAARKGAAPGVAAKKDGSRKRASPEERHRLIQQAAYFEAEKEEAESVGWFKEDPVIEAADDIRNDELQQPGD